MNDLQVATIRSPLVAEDTERNGDGTHHDHHINKYEVELPTVGAIEAFTVRLRAETDELISIVRGAGLEILSRMQNRGGSESEFMIVDEQMRPAAGINMKLLELIAASGIPGWVRELGSFQLELNGAPFIFTGNALSEHESEIRSSYLKASEIAATRGLKIIPTGCLPTVLPEDLISSNLTGGSNGRYGIASMHTRAYKSSDSWAISLQGNRGAEISYTVDSVMSVGFLCSLQPHLQASQEEFVGLYNASLAVAGFALGPCVGSPFVHGQIGHKESRIACYEQAWDERRVTFGNGYITHPAQRFLENCNYAVVYVNGETDDLQPDIIEFSALKLQNGSVHNWVRAVFDQFDNNLPHLRVEFRILPVAPAVCDNIANIAFYSGLAYGYANKFGDDPSALFSFDQARHNFYEVAKYGLEAMVYLPGEGDTLTKLIHAGEELISVADQGLASRGISVEDREKYLGIIRARFGISEELPSWASKSGVTEADWMLASYDALIEKGKSRDDALRIITNALAAAAERNISVTQRPLAQ